jgi:toxin ParE1/3/4
LADADIDTASAYLRTHDPHAASRLLAALERAFRELARHPGAGSPRYAHVLPAEGLRMWPVAGSAYLIFHLERADHIDIVRVLHGARDIPVLLRDVT